MEQTTSARYREEAERAERLAGLAVGDDLRRELLEIAAEFWTKSEACQRVEHKRLTERELGL